ncbi:MAG: 3-deoxy-manno-octulosonate cytidylyltransferase [Ignavibacteria bacterium]|nr:3-deoxy-manno-octulosonate cytidylyltransferase [Ignavibacteria bacterium]
MKVIGVIPARYASVRFPGKPLALINGKPMIQHVYERAMRSKKLSRLVVATDDKRIYNAVRSFWGEAVITSPKHKSGTDRMGEVAIMKEFWDGEIFVNIQGDEPLIDYRNIDKAAECLMKNKDIKVATLYSKITDPSDLINPNVVKVIPDKQRFAAMFLRKISDFKSCKKNCYKHIGLYAFRRDFLMKFIKMKPTKSELKEKLEQMRIIDNGYEIKLIHTRFSSPSVDTKDDLLKVIKKVRN